MVATTLKRHRGADAAFLPPRGRTRRPVLSREEEGELARRSAAGDREARDRLVEANLGLVVTIARRFLGRGLDLEDLVGEGTIGLIRASARFDPGLGTRFGTYAGHWVHQAIREALCQTGSAIRLPEGMVGLLKRWREAEWALGRDLGRQPSFDEVAAALGLTESRRAHVERALRAGRVRATGPSEEGQSIDEMVPSTDGTPVQERLESEEERAMAWRLIAGLEPRERTIVTLRFGLEEESPQTLEQIGRRLGLTRERVRQLEADALRKLGRHRLREAHRS